MRFVWLFPCTRRSLAAEVIEGGTLMGYAMRQPDGGPSLALQLDPARTEAAPGFDYFPSECRPGRRSSSSPLA
jgi:hypothetical protein